RDARTESFFPFALSKLGSRALHIQLARDYRRITQHRDAHIALLIPLPAEFAIFDECSKGTKVFGHPSDLVLNATEDVSLGILVSCHSLPHNLVTVNHGLVPFRNCSAKITVIRDHWIGLGQARVLTAFCRHPADNFPPLISSHPRVAQSGGAG